MIVVHFTIHIVAEVEAVMSDEGLLRGEKTSETSETSAGRGAE